MFDDVNLTSLTTCGVGCGAESIEKLLCWVLNARAFIPLSDNYVGSGVGSSLPNHYTGARNPTVWLPYSESDPMVLMNFRTSAGSTTSDWR